MTITSHINITLLEQGQAQKEITVNEALQKIDAILNIGAVSIGDTTPPVSPSNGDVYIVGNSATGDWSGYDNNIAYFETIWKFISPNEGMSLWVNDEDKIYSWDNSAWVNSGGRIIDQLTGLGIGTNSDTTNKLAVRSDAILMTTDTGNVQAKLNKNGASDTASFLFQTAFSGRAEFGLIGNDDFTLKVSSDGSSFVNSFSVNNATGDINFEKIISIPDGVSAPSTEVGKAKIYVDSVDGDLKVKFGDGTVKTIVTD